MVKNLTILLLKLTELDTVGKEAVQVVEICRDLGVGTFQSLELQFGPVLPGSQSVGRLQPSSEFHTLAHRDQ